MKNIKKGKSIFASKITYFFDINTFFTILSQIGYLFVLKNLMRHLVIIPHKAIFNGIIGLTEAIKMPSKNVSYEVFKKDSMYLLGNYETENIRNIVALWEREFSPDAIFFLSESYPVSDEKFSGDIILPNVFFEYNPLIEAGEITKENRDTITEKVLFLEQYNIQNDYNFESFGFSVGGINVSGKWNAEDEDFRTRLRLAYEPDTFDRDMFAFVEESKKLGIEKKIYPIATILSADIASNSANILSILHFLIGSIDGENLGEEEEE